jgi:Co/Zn/Cd efflux system component
MDCPSEENLIRIKLSEFDAVKSVVVDIPNRSLVVYHHEATSNIKSAVESLNLQGQLLSTTKVDNFTTDDAPNQRKLLWIVLSINFAFFLIESTTGLISKSMGLVADSLDMLADAFVYGISLLAVGRSVLRKKKVARLAGYFQLILALLGFSEIIRRFISGVELPDFRLMMIVSLLALIANSICLILLNRSSSKDEAHMKASMIFTSNDVIINLGVILAGGLVLWTSSGIPDLVVGFVVFVLVVRGALRILALGK